MGLVKGVKNVFGRKARKAKKFSKRRDALMDQLNDPLSDASQSATVNPLFQPAPAQAKPNAFAALAAEKKAKTGKGLGKNRLKDRHIGEMKGSDSADVGASAHEVKRVDYAREIGDSGTNEGFFKGADEEAFHGGHFAEKSGVGEWKNGDDHATVAPNLIARSVANTRLDQRLGMGTIAHEFEAKHNGERGVVSAKTDGVAAQETNDIDYSEPEMQRSLSDLQVFDYLTNQQDRHGGNVFVDKEAGVAKGIDNDLSMGAKDVGNNDRYHGMPSQIDGTMAARIEGLSAKELHALVGGEKGDYQRLSPEEQDAAVDRLETLKAHIGEENDDGSRKNVVDEWGDDTWQKTLDESAAMKDENSYGRMGNHAESITARLHYMQQRRIDEGIER